MTICTIMSGHCGNRLRTKYRANDDGNDYDEDVDEVNVVRFRGTGTGSTPRAPRTTTTT